MWRIIGFLSRFGNLLLFLLLEFVALIMIISLNKPHRQISQGVFTELSGSISEMQAGVAGYFNLHTENEKLALQNARLESELLRLRDSLRAYQFHSPPELRFVALPDSIRNDSTLRDSLFYDPLPDSVLPAAGFRFIPCRAINNGVHLNYNYITINKGRRHGVRPDMGLISPEGIAGQVIGVSRNFALALSVLNKEFRMSAKLLHNQNVGTLSWDGGHARYANLSYIPQTSAIRQGDTVVTSGFSTVFPPDYIVGTVDTFNTDAGDGFYDIRVRLSTNFSAIDNLFLVRHEYEPEIDSLESMKTTQ